MSGNSLASVWQIAPRIAAQVLGLPFAQYRPAGTGVALASGNQVGTVPVWITADSTLMAAKAFEYGKPEGYAAVDPALTQVGDYLVGSIVLGAPAQTFFIAAQDIPGPIKVVRCNQVISVRRPIIAALPGLNPNYGGDTLPDQPDVITSWPASVLVTLRAVRGPIELPGDTGLGRWVIILPVIPGVEIRTSDIVVLGDADKSRGVVNAAEITVQGWRLAVEQQAT